MFTLSFDDFLIMTHAFSGSGEIRFWKRIKTAVRALYHVELSS